MKRSLLVTAAWTAAVVLAVLCPPALTVSCPDRCVCVRDSVDCKDAGYSEVPSNLPKNTVTL